MKGHSTPRGVMIQRLRNAVLEAEKSFGKNEDQMQDLGRQASLRLRGKAQRTLLLQEISRAMTWSRVSAAAQ